MDKPQDRHTYTLCTLTCQFEGNHCGCKRSSIALMDHTHTHPDPFMRLNASTPTYLVLLRGSHGVVLDVLFVGRNG
jgi:hypothetical protein